MLLKKTGKKHRNFYVHARLDQEEYSRFRTLMEIGGYTSISCFLRDLIAQKRLPYRQEMAHISPRQLSDKVNVLIYQVNKIGIKRFYLHVHPYVAAYINKGVFSLKMQWQLKYGLGVHIVPSQKLAFLQYEFYDAKQQFIDMQEEIESTLQ